MYATFLGDTVVPFVLADDIDSLDSDLERFFDNCLGHLLKDESKAIRADDAMKQRHSFGGFDDDQYSG
jgi:hypothetical protein